MQDRFKYRCWHKPTKTMCEVFEFNKTFIKATPSFVVTSIRTIKTEDCILIQCTGLKDKNGELIYEGDIVKDRNNFILQITYRQDKGAFYLENNRIAGAIFELKCSTNTMEVIGNIYENPELIGGAE